MTRERGVPCVLACVLLAASGVAGCVAPAGQAPDAPALAQIGSSSAGLPRSVVWVSVSGLTPDRYLASDPAMPTVAAMARAGVAAERVASVTPASSYPVHASLVTGLPPALHGILADLRIGERGVRAAPHRHASLLRAVPLWQRVAADGGSVLALDWPTTQGADIAGLLPDSDVRAGQAWHLEAAAGASADLAGLVRAAPEAGRVGAPRDELLEQLACRALASEAPPALVLLRLREPEDSLVRTGPRSPASRASFHATDARIGRLHGCAGPRAAFVVSGDVAYEPVHTMLRPNAVLARAGIAVGGARGWDALVRSNGGSAFVYARDERSALEARRAFEAAARASAAFRVVGAEEMIARQADPDAWFGLAAEPGFAFVDDPTGDFEAPARVLGAGGYLEAPDRPSIGVVLWGRGVRSGVRVPVFSLLDVGPTVGKLLGVSLEPALGKPRLGLLRLGPQPPAAVERAGGERD